MTLNLFNQFASSTIMGFPLFIFSVTLPWLILFTPSNRWLNNRAHTTQAWLTKQFTKEIFSPLQPQSHKWAMILIANLMFLLGANLLGLLPYTFTPTTQLSLNLSLAVPLWLTTVIIGLRNQASTSFAHFLPEGTPTLLIPALVIIETISLFIRPLALGVRLTANLTAGHLLIQLISTAVLTMNSITLSSLTFILLLLFTGLEIAVAIIQAYVFSLLLSLYLQENTAH